MRSSPLARAFALLDEFRTLPAYQLERRLDILIAVFLVDVAEKKLGVALEPQLIPELPLRAGLLDPTSTAPNTSKKVDYLLLARDRSRAFLVELKTDPGSRLASQDAYLAAARRLGLPAILDGIIALAIATDGSGREKYLRLLHALADMNLVTLPADLDALVRARHRKVKARLREVTLAHAHIPLDVVYVQPRSTEGDLSITFEDIAAHLDSNRDELSVLLRGALRRWR